MTFFDYVDESPGRLIVFILLFLLAVNTFRFYVNRRWPAPADDDFSEGA